MGGEVISEERSIGSGGSNLETQLLGFMGILVRTLDTALGRQTLMSKRGRRRRPGREDRLDLLESRRGLVIHCFSHHGGGFWRIRSAGLDLSGGRGLVGPLGHMLISLAVPNGHSKTAAPILRQ